jgi:hypothetical protein
MKKLFWLMPLTIAVLSLLNCKKVNEYKGLDCSAVNPTYTGAIKAIVDANCTMSGCHNAGSPNGNYTTYEGLLIRVNNGTLSKRVLYTKDMPKGGSLSLEDRKKLKCWIDAGAPRD